MAILGAHMSIAGGYYRAVERAKEAGCDCVQLFTKNNNQWRAKELTREDIAQFRSALTEHKILHPIAHDSYLINLASPDAGLWKKSVDSFVVEVLRAENLGLEAVVTHPGAHTCASAEAGLKAVVRALDEVHGQTRGAKLIVLLETTAGQGSCLGWRFEHLAEIMGSVKDPDRLGVCFDTCHVHAAGYELGTQRGYQNTMKQLADTVGLEHVRAFHVNDSKNERGSRVDRHAHIGRGRLGLEAFRLLLADRRFRGVPMYIETKKEQENGVEMDVVNLGTLRSLLVRPRATTGNIARKARSEVARETRESLERPIPAE